MTIAENRRGRGRPRAFDEEAALESAMRVFWAAGYEGASVPMLTDAMGISAQSLYAAFGSKEALYRKAIAAYVTTIGGFAARALEEEPDAIKAVVRVLRDAAITFTRTEGIPGCMITTAPAEISETPLTRLGRDLRSASIKALEERLKRGMEDGQLPRGFPYIDFARYVGSIVQGMSIQARDGATGNELLSIAEIAAQSLESYRLNTRS